MSTRVTISISDGSEWPLLFRDPDGQLHLRQVTAHGVDEGVAALAQGRAA